MYYAIMYNAYIGKLTKIANTITYFLILLVSC